MTGKNTDRSKIPEKITGIRSKMTGEKTAEDLKPLKKTPEDLNSLKQNGLRSKITKKHAKRKL